MKRRHHFGDGERSHVRFGFGSDQQARRCLGMLNRHKVVNRYHLTHLDEGEKPDDEGVLIDLDTGEILPNRHKRTAAQA